MSMKMQKAYKLPMLGHNIQLDPNWTKLPCQPCPMLERCGIGNEINPVTCKLINEWLDSLLRDKKNGSSAI